MKLGLFSTPRYLLYVVYGLFWALFALAGLGILQLFYRVARDYGLSVLLPTMLLSFLVFLTPLFLGAALGVLIVGYLSGKNTEQQKIYRVWTFRNIAASLCKVKARQVFLFVPVYFISGLIIDIPVGALMYFLGMPSKIYISHIENIGDYLYYSQIISYAMAAFAIVILGKKFSLPKHV